MLEETIHIYLQKFLPRERGKYLLNDQDQQLNRFSTLSQLSTTNANWPNLSWLQPHRIISSQIHIFSFSNPLTQTPILTHIHIHIYIHIYLESSSLLVVDLSLSWDWDRLCSLSYFEKKEPSTILRPYVPLNSTKRIPLNF